MKKNSPKKMRHSWMAFFNCMTCINKKSMKTHPIRVTQDLQQQLESEPSDIPTPKALVNVDFGETPSKKVETPPSMNTQTASDTSLETPPPSLGDQPHKSAAVVAPILPETKQKAGGAPHIGPASHCENTLFEPPTDQPHLDRPMTETKIITQNVQFLGCYYDE